MKDNLEKLRRAREYYLGEKDAYAYAIRLVEHQTAKDTIRYLINLARDEAEFYDREISKIEESLTSK